MKLMFLGFIGILMLSTSNNASASPWFCKGLECPKFNLLNKTKDYEVRQYGSLTWVTTSHIGQWKSDILGELLFKNLFSYIEGNNTMKKQLDLAVPLLTKLESAGDRGSIYTMHLLIPRENIDHLPSPLNTNLTFITIPPSTYYIRSFDGVAYDRQYMKVLQELVNAINDTGAYPDDFFYTATYDHPQVKENRHNEVWLLKKEKIP
ncbi:hypothetical protein LOTGIDRAFT_205030 [Lottia gigantea]|uniref:Heme-binding protein 2 n=1 Tax=Lottia gigantea TaxID=225164 RepID=V4B0H8_LOTGI|nr:hypothetical protein LOTGIDRAFT_205030 [Lottia gigantea]ESP03588.1 hypothetical protein LOTGIDRAFT_205030 [Lottia gigantea]